jgi:hypothetical protein
LAKEGLVPRQEEGKAQIIIIGGNMKYGGIEFTEVSISVIVEPRIDEQENQCVFLVKAFNSSRLFTFCERVFFSTPYSHAECRLSVGLPASVSVCRSDLATFEAQMNRGDRATTVGEAELTCEILLPSPKGGRRLRHKYYVAHLSGIARSIPFLPEQDSLRIQPAEGSQSLQYLIDSSFSPTSWLIRDDARHARSKTFMGARP